MQLDDETTRRRLARAEIMKATLRKMDLTHADLAYASGLSRQVISKCAQKGMPLRAEAHTRGGAGRRALATAERLAESLGLDAAAFFGPEDKA